ncbi:MAG TPA: M20 family metallopeptidase [Candidatus Limnocylindria bacterium]|nr:M20 family metallopeptidase [Candidatus Limnocylindria bacterium]
MTSPLLAAAHTILTDFIPIRRAIHRRPELGLDLPETQQRIVNELRRVGLEPKLGNRLSSVTATIGEGRPGRTVVLRADMDALPLTEDTGLDFASEIDGRMHACGHDTHVAMLLGAARLLVERFREDAASLPGPVRLMFQPGEEGHFGARVMLEEGFLDDLTREHARGFAIHISAQYPSGEVHSRAGALLASADNFSITVRGSGGHASAPHNAKDPIPAAAEIVTALQVAISRSVDVFDPAVLTIGHVSAGTTFNIIPETARLEGTFRSVSDARRAAMPDLIRQVVDGVAAAHGLEAEVEVIPLYPVTVNDAGVFEGVRDIAGSLVGEANVHVMPAPMMAAEDWSYVLQRIPGVMVNLGARPRDRVLEGFPQNHSNLVVFDEDAMAVGVALYAAVAQQLDPEA